MSVFLLLFFSPCVSTMAEEQSVLNVSRLNYCWSDILYFKRFSEFNSDKIIDELNKGLYDIGGTFNGEVLIEGIEIKRIIGVLCLVGLLNGNDYLYQHTSKLEFIQIFVDSNYTYFSSFKSLRNNLFHLLKPNLLNSAQSFDSTSWFKNNYYAFFSRKLHRDSCLLQGVSENKRNFVFAPIVLEHYLQSLKNEKEIYGAVDIHMLILRKLRNWDFFNYIKGNGGSCILVLEHILGPHEVLEFFPRGDLRHVTSDFFENNGPIIIPEFISFEGFGNNLSYTSALSPDDFPSTDHLSVLLVGVTEVKGENMFLLQTWFSNSQFIEVSADFLLSRAMDFVYVKGFRGKDLRIDCADYDTTDCAFHEDCIVNTSNACDLNKCSKVNSELECVYGVHCCWNSFSRKCSYTSHDPDLQKINEHRDEEVIQANPVSVYEPTAKQTRTPWK